MSEVNYYSENSDVTLLGPDGAGQASWRPGDAGLSERVAMGSGLADGWFVYFLERLLIVEVWAGGAWQLTRTLDCSALTEVGGSRWRHLVAFGYDAPAGRLSLGVVSRNKDNPGDARSVYGEWLIPNLAHVFAHPPVIELGTLGVAAPGGVQTRSLGASVRSVAGRVASRSYLTRGELARISGREVRGVR